mmetsp:Transcript_4669/g.12711  ORF Transcript_4669/g.12711 Transcript_4669/m.12711 type:complete len:424 (-) Transcript_4669:369-1640(-)
MKPAKLLPNGLHHELSHVHKVLHGRGVLPSELQHDVHELGERQLHVLARRVRLEDAVREVHQPDRVHAHLCQRSHGALVVQDLLELFLGDHHVAVVVKVLDDSLHPGVGEVHGHLLLLHGRHRLHDLAEDADEHVHQRQRRQQHEDDEERGADRHLVADVVDHLGDVVQERARHGQRVHGVRNRREVHLSHLRLGRELSEGDREDVHQDDEQQHDEEHGAHGRHHTLDEDEQLGHRSQHPRHPRQPEEPEEPQDGRVAQRAAAAAATAAQRHDDGHHPGLRDHHEDEGRVEAEPAVPRAVPLVLEGHEAGEQLKDKVHSEEVLHDLESWFGHEQHRGFVVVRIDPDPERVEADDPEGRVLEDRVPSDGLPDALGVVLVFDVVHLSHETSAHLLLHLVSVDEHRVPAASPVAEGAPFRVGVREA